MNQLIVVCDECECEHIIDANNFEIEIVDVDPGRDSGMGARTQYSGEYELSCTGCNDNNCENSITIEVNYWEYPQGSLEESNFSSSGGTITQEFTIDVSVE